MFHRQWILRLLLGQVNRKRTQFMVPRFFAPSRLKHLTVVNSCNATKTQTMQITGKHAHQVTLLTYIELRKFGKIRYISNLLDFFGRNNFELTKKKSFTRVSSRRKRLQTQHVCKAPRTLGIWDFKFACFLTINSLKATYMHTFEDIKRIFISESGIEQVLKQKL